MCPSLVSPLATRTRVGIPLNSPSCFRAVSPTPTPLVSGSTTGPSPTMAYFNFVDPGSALRQNQCCPCRWSVHVSATNMPIAGYNVLLVGARIQSYAVPVTVWFALPTIIRNQLLVRYDGLGSAERSVHSGLPTLRKYVKARLGIGDHVNTGNTI
jgi:hypothetical protein